MLDPTALQISDVPIVPRPPAGVDGIAKFMIRMGPRPERVTVRAKTVDLADAIKDEASRQAMEAMHTRAIPGVDYESKEEVIVFDPGDTLKFFDVPIHGSAPVPTRIFDVNISTDDGVPIIRPVGACLLIS